MLLTMDLGLHFTTRYFVASMTRTKDAIKPYLLMRDLFEQEQSRPIRISLYIYMNGRVHCIISRAVIIIAGAVH